jgi:hypothetical protein
MNGNFYFHFLMYLSYNNNVSIKSARAFMVQNCHNEILEGLAVADPPPTLNPLFLGWKDWWL